MTIKGRKAGRPAVWADARTRQQAYQQRQREKMQLINELIQAAVNAHWEDPELDRRIRSGCDAEVLQALIDHYRALHWQRFLSPPEHQRPVRCRKGGDVAKAG